ncbi:IS110 family RNA-guided transposase [Halanaeroarchaeum sulfurireducens]|uniref:Transposase IS116/IS110/IS902 family protein n=1 Tax=Halanaeroarchaeum sulfurireducens TaxID=1604004 RepID=A0A0F7PDA2_9EURY|nr:IS110 family transposase [Halanaeroarchaeum sulfurireducens]AKH98667.1 transposase IS116/IS110/IS902 family protein [Halanaeroarchaeum sulfurireducens]ALG83110.1 transposase IS116/IS110/IS902 family protein [Halanaeroarchaeum sulfurireducens]
MYIGLDLHKHYSQIAVMTEDGEIVAEQRLENEHDKLESFASEYAGSEVAIEATGSYRYVYDILDQEMDVTLVNPSKTRVIAEAKVKTDSIDAKMLAHLLRADLVAESYVPPEDIRQARDLVRARKSLVEERTAEKNRVRAVLSRTGNSFDGDLFGKDGRAFLDDLELSTVDRGIIEAHIAAIDALNEQIEKLEHTIEEIAGADEDTQRLMSIPGVSYFTSLLIKSEIGEIDRFPSADQLVSYAGLDPSVRQSGDKEIRGGITKEGSAPLRWALVQCANVAVRFDEYLGNFYTRLEERKNHQVAIVATARKMLVSIFYMLSREEVYDPNVSA